MVNALELTRTMIRLSLHSAVFLSAILALSGVQPIFPYLKYLEVMVNCNCNFSVESESSSHIRILNMFSFTSTGGSLQRLWIHCTRNGKTHSPEPLS